MSEVTFKIEGTVLKKCEGSADVIEIPKGVTAIYGWAFHGVSAERLIVPEGVTDIEQAFLCSKIKEIVLPSSLTVIGKSAFGGCELLEKLVIPESVTAIGSGAFGRCLSLTELVIPEGVVSIEERCFESCGSLLHVTLPSTLKSIGEKAFSHCDKLEELHIPTVWKASANVPLRTAKA